MFHSNLFFLGYDILIISILSKFSKVIIGKPHKKYKKMKIELKILNYLLKKQLNVISCYMIILLLVVNCKNIRINCSQNHRPGDKSTRHVPITDS